MVEEVHDAMEYAKCYQENKSENSTLARKFMEIATDELKHAEYLHDMVHDEFEELMSKDMSLEEFISEMWTEKNNDYLDKIAKVRYILAM